MKTLYLLINYFYHILLDKWTEHGKLPSITTDPNINNSKLKNLVIRIELTRAILMPRFTFSEKLDHPFSHFFIFGNMFSESHGFVAIPVTRCIEDTLSITFYISLVLTVDS